MQKQLPSGSWQPKSAARGNSCIFRPPDQFFKSWLDRHLMTENLHDPQILLSVVITVVSGKQATAELLAHLCPQLDPKRSEIIVPFDRWSAEIGELTSEFPEVTFHLIDGLGAAESEQIASHQHRLYDRRRSAGLNLARGQIVAMTEDHAQPADDWVEQIVAAHEQPYLAIGGAIENGVDAVLNRAVYFCDFGRYGRPFESGPAAYISDVNVAYKREALEATRAIWQDAYHETTVHWAMLSKGQTLYLDDRPVVFQKRRHLTLRKALGERVEWGRVFAETRANELSKILCLLYAAGSPLLPPLMLFRGFRNMWRQQLTFGRMISTLPVAFLLLCGWSCGEFVGYCFKEPKEANA
ncbi:MAG: hypothetical protein JSS77_15675 [Acidobacteria bacterium]|nr:hypothetical protein [Acidobacteriota bacterium]